MTWFQTWSAAALDYDRPSPDQILLPDVALSLSRQPRFNGHTQRAWTVGEHAIGCSILAERLGMSPAIAYAALHHDDGEAYLGDIPGPARPWLGQDWKTMEERIEAAIAIRFEVLAAGVNEIRRLDLAMLEAERRRFYLPPPRQWMTTAQVTADDVSHAGRVIGEVLDRTGRGHPHDVKIRVWFIERHRDLYDGRGTYERIDEDIPW